MKKSLTVAVVLTILTLASAGTVLASPCLHLDVYPNPDGSGTKEVCLGIEVPYFGTPVGSDGTEVLRNGRLWFGTDSPTNNSKGWDWRSGEDDYRAVLYGGIVGSGSGGLQLVILNNAKYTGLNDSATLEVFDPSLGMIFSLTPNLTSGDGTTDPFVLYTNASFTMTAGVFYPFRVVYTHDLLNGSTDADQPHDGFDLRLLGAASFTEPTCPPVPEPATLLLLGLGLVGMAGYGRKRKM